MNLDLSYCPSSALQQQLRSPAMRLLLRLEDKQLSCVNLSHIIKTSLLSES